MRRIGPGHYRRCKHEDTIKVWARFPKADSGYFHVCKDCGYWFWYSSGISNVGYHNTSYGKHICDVREDIGILLAGGA